MEQHLEKSAGKLALQKFFTCGSGDLVSILLSASRENLSPTYGTRVLKFFNKLFQLGKSGWITSIIAAIVVECVLENTLIKINYIADLRIGVLTQSYWLFTKNET